MKILAVLVLGIIILIFVVIPSFKPKQTSTDQICQKINQEDVKSLCLAMANKDEKYC